MDGVLLAYINNDGGVGGAAHKMEIPLLGTQFWNSNIAID